MGIDILGIDIMGVDILGIDISAPTRIKCSHSSLILTFYLMTPKDFDKYYSRPKLTYNA